MNLIDCNIVDQRDLIFRRSQTLVARETSTMTEFVLNHPLKIYFGILPSGRDVC